MISIYVFIGESIIIALFMALLIWIIFILSIENRKKDKLIKNYEERIRYLDKIIDMLKEDDEE